MNFGCSSQDYFVDGLTDELVTRLYQYPSSSFACVGDEYKGTTKTIPEIDVFLRDGDARKPCEDNVAVNTAAVQNNSAPAAKEATT